MMHEQDDEDALPFERMIKRLAETDEGEQGLVLPPSSGLDEEKHAETDSWTPERKRGASVEPDRPWDCCFVMPVNQEAKSGLFGRRSEEEEGFDWRDLIVTLTEGGLEYSSYYSIQQDEIYVKVRAAARRLQIHADVVDFKCLLDEEKTERSAKAGFPDLGIGPIFIGSECDGESLSSYRPYEHIYAKYDTDVNLVDLYAKPEYENTEGYEAPFSSMVRLKLIYSILNGPKRQGGCSLRVPELINSGRILAFLCMHEPKERTAMLAAFREAPLWYRPSALPIFMLRDYFGEQIGLVAYFAAHLCDAYLCLFLIGVATTIETIVHDTADVIMALPYCFVVICWSVMTVEFWKRRQATTACESGMIGFEAKEKARPQYRGKVIRSPISGAEELYFPRREQRRRVLYAYTMISAMIGLVVAFLIVVFFLKAKYPTFGIYTSFINSVGIVGFNYQFQQVAIRLTDHENWRTETQYQDRLTVKLFCFSFVNSYSALFYSTFIQYYANPFVATREARANGENNYSTVAENVMNDLKTQVFLIFLISLITNNVTKTLVPLLNYYYQKRAEGGLEMKMSVAELQYILVEYDEALDTISTYMALTIQHGYIVLFSVAFPAASLFAFMSITLQLRTTPYKFATLYRRIQPEGAEDIGIFQTFFELLNIAGIVTNLAIVVYIKKQFNSKNGFSDHERDVVFIVMVSLALAALGIIELCVADIPGDVTTQILRSEFVNDKIINKLADEDEQPHLCKHRNAPDYTLRSRDEGYLYFGQMEHAFAYGDDGGLYSKTEARMQTMFATPSDDEEAVIKNQPHSTSLA